MKHKICKGKIYVTTIPILGVLKHFVEDFKLQFIEKTGINIKARFALWILNINVSLKKELGIAKVICKPPVLVPKTAQKSYLSKFGEMAHV